MRGTAQRSCRPAPWAARVVTALVIVLLSWGIAGAQQRIVFRWGKSMRIASYEVDLENRSLSVTLPAGGSIEVPLSIVRRVVGPAEEVLFDLDFETAPPDPHEPTGTLRWIPVEGWSTVERWDAWEGDPKWDYRWSVDDVASALLPGPREGSDQIEIRLLSISYALRSIGGVQDPEPQIVDVTLNGESLGSLPLSSDGWETYRLPLPPDLSGGSAVLRLTTAYRARPADFAEDVSDDPRSLGVALDSVRYCPCP